MVTLPGLPQVSHLVQRILQATQRTKEPHRKEREKERKGLQKSALGTLLSLIKFSHPWLTLRQQPDLQNMLIFLLMFCCRQ